MKAAIIWQGTAFRCIEVADREVAASSYYFVRPGFRLRFEHAYGDDSQGVTAWLALDENDRAALLHALYAMARSQLGGLPTAAPPPPPDGGVKP